MKRCLLRLFHICAVLMVPFCTLLAALVGWMFRTWPHLKLEELRYELRAPLVGTGGGLIKSAVLSCALPALLALILMIALTAVLRKKHPRALVCTYLVLCICAGILAGGALFTAADRLDLAGYRSRMAKNHSYIEDHYVYPDNAGLEFPEKKRNLIYIFLESMESTFADRANGGAFEENRIPELTKLALENEDFSGSSPMLNCFDTPYSTTWTMAAMFAHSSGLPLIVNVGNNLMNTQEDFFPSMVNLGDILQREGYNQTLMVGSDADFGGRTLYYQAHGDYRIHDHEYAIAEGLLPPGYHVWWGYEDSKLFDHAKEELKRLSALDQPFNLKLLTVDTHFEDGYVCPLCPDTFGDQYSNVLACSSHQTAAFVEWIRQQDFYEDTAIVLVGDHLTMDADYLTDLDPAYERKAYTAFINASAECETDKPRVFSTFDLFPTTLSAMGVTIHGDRLGLGTDLFSATPTLLETDGLAMVDDELKHRSLFMEHLSSVQLDYGQCSLNFLRGEKDGWIRAEVRDIANMAHSLESVVLELTGSAGKTQKITLQQHADRSYTADIDLSGFENGVASYRLFANGPDDVSYQLASDSGKMVLCERTDLSSCLDELLKLEGHSIFMAAAGDVSGLMTEEVVQKLQALGIQSDLSQIASQSFYAVITPEGVAEQMSPDSLYLRADMANGSHYTIVSNGAQSQQEGCHIYIGSKDYAPNTAGLNIVVYDPASAQVVDVSAYGDASCPVSADFTVDFVSATATARLSAVQHSLPVKGYQLWYWDDASISMPHKANMAEVQPGVYEAKIDLANLDLSKLYMTAYAVCEPEKTFGTVLGLDLERLIPLGHWNP